MKEIDELYVNDNLIIIVKSIPFKSFLQYHSFFPNISPGFEEYNSTQEKILEFEISTGKSRRTYFRYKQKLKKMRLLP